MASPIDGINLSITPGTGNADDSLRPEFARGDRTLR
jgi:hypothetical protein